ncbi:hypothetical protein GGTG_10520 [Gaeumannomyces tritici R3-111a-1]|uniref:Uncharacterized protein n=1 Tax=Gaeumannomyces tritici (strain R3-111a-1) TaxID=644352 RepID=J3PAJ5_GAET3|nr:hypothetical protein GGTG_10520 [Gaeumannomyces tritici R3-111a-1]EJT71261.1 hypothetical protein GGTG_10520 [Gaeumannomyces tritici R3-111a-1]
MPCDPFGQLSEDRDEWREKREEIEAALKVAEGNDAELPENWWPTTPSASLPLHSRLTRLGPMPPYNSFNNLQDEWLRRKNEIDDALETEQAPSAEELVPGQVQPTRNPQDAVGDLSTLGVTRQGQPHASSAVSQQIEAQRPSPSQHEDRTSSSKKRPAEEAWPEDSPASKRACLMRAESTSAASQNGTGPQEVDNGTPVRQPLEKLQNLPSTIGVPPMFDLGAPYSGESSTAPRKCPAELPSPEEPPANKRVRIVQETGNQGDTPKETDDQVNTARDEVQPPPEYALPTPEKASDTPRRGRGRLRKNFDADEPPVEVEQDPILVATPRGHGRPKKGPETPVTITPRRTRGHSRRELEAGSAVTPARRGRGRPRRQPAAANQTPAESDVASGGTPKCGCGHTPTPESAPSLAPTWDKRAVRAATEPLNQGGEGMEATEAGTPLRTRAGRVSRPPQRWMQ